MRRRATSGEMARGGLVFVFFFGGCSDVGGGFFCGWTGSHCGGMCWRGRGCERILPSVVPDIRAATAVTENAGGEVESCRGRSEPEIGMEHASRGRRSGNKGVGARWRGRFRIFSARHCSRTEVSHAENSGMTTIFLTSSVSPTPPPADWGGRIRCAGRPREWSCGAVPPQERWHEGGWFLFFSLGVVLRCRRGILLRLALGAIAGACVGRGRGCER